jgi:CheY-like chemotaxis protein
VVVESRPGQGARFDLYFPAAELTRSRQESPPPAPLSASEVSLRILCLDDDAAVLAALEAMLAHTGHRVRCSTSPREALDVLRADPLAFDLIVTDYTMPQLSGLEFAREVEVIRAELPIILISGYAEIAGFERLPGNIRAVLVKPMTLQAFFEAIRTSTS